MTLQLFQTPARKPTDPTTGAVAKVLTGAKELREKLVLVLSADEVRVQIGSVVTEGIF